MSHWVIRAPKTVARWGPRGKYASSITIALGEKATSDVAYRVRVDAEFSGGKARLGVVRTIPPLSLRAPARIVAIASAPGVLEWTVVVTPVRPYGAKDVGGTLKIEGCEYPACQGLYPMGGSLLESGGPQAGAYRHLAGGAPGSAVIPAGSVVDSYSVNASAGGGTVDITSPIFGALPQIVIPANVAFDDQPENMLGPFTIAFGGDVNAWAVGYRETRA